MQYNVKPLNYKQITVYFLWQNRLRTCFVLIWHRKLIKLQVHKKWKHILSLEIYFDWRLHYIPKIYLICNSQREILHYSKPMEGMFCFRNLKVSRQKMLSWKGNLKWFRRDCKIYMKGTVKVLFHAWKICYLHSSVYD